MDTGSFKSIETHTRSLSFDDKADNLPVCKHIKLCPSVPMAPSQVTSPSQATGSNKDLALRTGTQLSKTFRFDFLFIDSDQKVTAFLDTLPHKSPNSDIAYMSQADGLCRDNLVTRVVIDSDGKHQIHPGKLFKSGQPVTLVLDIRNIASEELSTFNELLDPDIPSLYNKALGQKTALGKHVTIVVLAHPNQLKTAGADFWRRVNRPDNTWKLANADTDEAMETGTTASPLLQSVDRDSIVSSDLVLDLHLHGNWRRLFYGCPGVNESGRITYLPGVLSSLQPDQRVVLRGVDPNDLELRQHVQSMIWCQQFEANGETHSLPSGITFVQTETPDDELPRLLASIVNCVDTPPSNTIIINQANLLQWLNPVQINNEGIAVPNRSLNEQLEKGFTLTVTSPLTEEQWFLLLGHIQLSGYKPDLYTLDKTITPSSSSREQSSALPVSSAIRTIRYSSESQANEWRAGNTREQLVIRINAKTTPSQLFDNIHIKSERRCRFGSQKTAFQQALESGQPVTITGLETNPRLQCYLESLCCHRPAVIINGFYAAYPKASIQLLWPEGQSCTSPVWTTVIEKGESLMESDLWVSAASRHNLDASILPREVLTKLYQVFTTIPNNITEKPGELPALTGELLDNLVKTAIQAQKRSQSSSLQPGHWRKAINSVVTHRLRHNPHVRDFMKVVCAHLLPDAEETLWVDRKRLASLLTSARKIDTAFVNHNFWRLARAFGPNVIPELNWHYSSSGEDYRTSFHIIEIMQTLLVIHGPEQLRKSMTLTLNPAPELVEKYQNLTIHERKEETPAQWQERRLTRLQERLAISPIIFIQGETGTGKSYLSAKMAYMSGPAFIVSVGPTTGEGELIRKWEWQSHSQGDRKMVCRDKILMKWTQAQPAEKDTFITLVVDEASLTDDGLLDCFKGLWQTPPCIYVGGQPVQVSSKHRVIMTGNPEHYGGRRMDRALGDKMQCLFYPPLPETFLRQQVIEPALANHLKCYALDEDTQDIAQKTVDSVWALWTHYKTVIPGREFTPRDLMDICAWVGWYLQQTASASVPVSQPHLNTVILQAFRDVVGSEIPDNEKDRLFALESWFMARFPVDDETLTQLRNQVLQSSLNLFRAHCLQSQSDFDTSPVAVTELAENLMQDLMRCQQAFQGGNSHRGRQATLIEGPTGRGKDVTLRQAITSFQQQCQKNGQAFPSVNYLNACDCSWDTLCQNIQRARTEGLILVIPEMNRIESQHLEGELNELLAGSAHPGFHLFATINPQEYTGRKPLSPALKGRFRRILARAYNQQELARIAGSALPDSASGKALAQQLTTWHCQLRQALVRNNVPLVPTAQDLKILAAALVCRRGDSAENVPDQEYILSQLNRHYRLYLMAAEITAEKLISQPCPPKVTDVGELDKELCHWLHTSLNNLDHPWQIRRSTADSLNPHASVITVRRCQDVPTAQQVILKKIAEAHWLESGLPVSPPDACDTLTQTLYRHWQQQWFNKHFGHTGISADPVFPLTNLQTETQNLATNQPYLQALNRLVEQTTDDYNPDCLPAIWSNIQEILEKPVKYYFQRSAEAQDHKKTVGGEEDETANAPLDQQATLPRAKVNVVDSETAYAKRASPSSFTPAQVFDQIYDCRMYRLRVYDLTLSEDGELTETRYDRGEYGLEVVNPGKIPRDLSTIPLSRSQAAGTVALSVTKNQWFYLPSLKSEERLVSLRLRSEKTYRILKDRYTGLHMIHVLDAPSEEEERIVIDYILDWDDTSKRESSSERQQAPLPAKLHRPDATCPEAIRRWIDKLFSPEVWNQLPDDQVSELKNMHNPLPLKNQVSAITRYCQKFVGNASPEDQNLFYFLLKERQGTCRHRTPVFVALCRYYGIPARIIKSEPHVFPEYSLDGGQTWQSVDLGGAPGDIHLSQIARPKATEGNSLHRGSQSMQALFACADHSQREALAQALGISLAQLDDSITTGLSAPSGLPPYINNRELISRLWKQETPQSLTAGLKILQNPSTSEGEIISLIGGFSHYKPIAQAVKIPLEPEHWTGAITQALEYIYHQLVVPGKIHDFQLYHAIVVLLEGKLQSIKERDPCVLHFAKSALERGWLDGITCSADYSLTHHNVLKQLEAIDELRVPAGRALTLLYNVLVKGRVPSYRALVNYREEIEKDVPFILPAACSGHSPSLEKAVRTSDLTSHWTDEPEGVPDIERLLTHNPAFPAFQAGRTKHRPVILLGALQKQFKQSPAYDSVRQALIKQLHIESQNSLPEGREGEVPWTLEKTADEAIKAAFISYIYQLTTSKEGQLTCCCIQAAFDEYYLGIYGQWSPKSPAELWNITQSFSSHSALIDKLDSKYVKLAFNSPNALVLKHNGELLNIAAEEFIGSLDVKALYNQVSSRYQTQS